MRQLRKLSFVMAAILPLLAILFSPQARAKTGTNPLDLLDSWALCAAAIEQAERNHGLPPHLLAGISKVESGRWNKQKAELFAWPWTVMAEGRSRYLPNKAAAIAEVTALKAKGVRNIDVGCMQVNLRYHPEAFASLETAFDPAHNAAYAATLLAKLRVEARSWTKAIGLYHSSTPVLSNKYRLKVFRSWRTERHRVNRKRRAEQLAQAARAKTAKN